MRDDYKHGDYNVICDKTGFKVKFSETRKEWNGLRVWKEVWEPRHPQDFVRGRVDKMSVYDPRPEGDNVFVDTDFILTENGDNIVTHVGFNLRTE